MPLEEIDLQLPASAASLPDDVAALIRESDRRIDEFFHSERNRKLPKYMPGDSELLYAALKSVTDRDLPLGRVYCEWGSGFGIGTCLASMLGYDAWGIEIEDQLVDISIDLAGDLDVDANFLNTSYLPDGFESYEGVGGEILVRDEDFSFPGDDRRHEPIYEGMDHELAEVDVFHAYPWPYQQEFMHQLFDAVAVEGALLITYLGSGEMTAYRKTAGDGDEIEDTLSDRDEAELDFY